MIRSSEDAFVDQLFADAPAYGAPLLAAMLPRAYLDLNRAPDELDPAVIEGISRAPHNPRVASGLGVIPRVVAGGRAIYRGKLPLAEVEDRIRRYWHPYHRALRDLVEAATDQFRALVDMSQREADGFDSATKLALDRFEALAAEARAFTRADFS